MKRTIQVKNHVVITEEFTSAGTITPGMLVELDSTGKIRAHSTSDGDALPMFAIEDSLQGKTIDDNYSASDQVQVWVPTRGDVVNGILASGQNVSIGTFLTSNGNGHLRAVSDPSSLGIADTEKIVGVAIEAINASAAAKRILVMVK